MDLARQSRAQETDSAAGTGGAGGGGNGGANTGASGNGTDGLGGGGGGRGADGAGGQGGSGIVIARYAGASLGAIGGTVTSGSGSAAGYTLHTFTTTGTTTTTSALNLSGVDMSARLGVTLTGVISGTGSLAFAGPGRLTLAAENTFTGDTRISSGTLGIGTGNALRNSTLDMNASDSGAISLTIPTFLGGLKGSRAVDNGGNDLFIGGNDQSTTYSGGLSGTGGLIKFGTGTLTLTGVNTFTGDTELVKGTLAVGNANALAGSTLSLGGEAEGTITFLQASNIGGLSGADVVLDNGGYTLTIGRNNQSTLYSGGISGAGGLTKSGTGTLTLSGSSSYTGLTWVREGTLATGTSNAFAAASDLEVDSGATFDRVGYSQTFANAVVNGTVGNTGNGGLLTVNGQLSGAGVVNGNVLVNGVHAPGNSSGNSPGIQTFSGDLSYGSGATINWELLANTASNSPLVFDQIVLSNAANLSFSATSELSLSFAGAGSVVDWNDAFWDVNRVWTVFGLASGVTTGFSNLSLGGSFLDANGTALEGTRG